MTATNTTPATATAPATAAAGSDGNGQGAPRHRCYGDLLALAAAVPAFSLVPDGDTNNEPPSYAKARELHGKARVRKRNIDKPNASELDPATEMIVFLKAREVDGESTIRFWRDGMHQWSESAYRPLTPNEVRAAIVRYLNRDTRNVRPGVVSAMVEQLRAQTILPSPLDQPAWIGKPPRPWQPAEIFATRDGLIHLPSFVDHPRNPQEYRLKPTPKFFSSVTLDCEFNPDAKTPEAWLRFLDELWPDDAASVELLQDFCGYALTPDTSQQKIMLVVGPRRAGKGVLSRVLRGVVGKANTCSPTLASLARPFGLQSLLGKTVAIVEDARLSSKTDAAIVTERLLTISGEGEEEVDRKHLPPLASVRLPVRFLIVTNELPRLIDSSGALSSRMLILQLTESWLGREDVGLTNRLLEELPGILLWAVAGWRRLRERGHFAAPDASQEVTGQLEELGSPVGAFVKERCRLAPEAGMSRAALYDTYRTWAKEAGRDFILDRVGFGRDLRAAAPKLRHFRHREPGGQPVWWIGGITLKGEDF